MEKLSTSQLDKQIKLIKKSEPLGSVTIGYETYLFPWDKAIEFMALFKHAEQLSNLYDEHKVEIHTVKERLELKPFDIEKYQLIKVAKLIGVSYKELIESQKEETNVAQP